MSGSGTAPARLDGPAKVTGAAHYGSDAPFSNPAYGFLVTSPISRGRIVSFDLREARALPGVNDIFTYQTIGKIEAGKTFDGGGYLGSTIAPMESAEIFHDGQIVAIVVADTFEIARDSAHRVKVEYAPETPSATFDSPGAETVEAKVVSKKHKDPAVGDAEKAFADAPVKIDQRSATSTEHHNTIELFTTACSWKGGR